MQGSINKCVNPTFCLINCTVLSYNVLKIHYYVLTIANTYSNPTKV